MSGYRLSNSNYAIQDPRMNNFFILFLLFFSTKLFAQETDSTDTATLETVTVKAFEQNRKLKDVAAAVIFINRQDLERFGNASAVQAVNVIPGVHLEERSPGSYRVNIRGSSLRSPFGVRNTKVYYNDLPFTNPGGDSYLNALGAYNYSSVEIIKGPGSNVYGAGTGGVLLIEGMNAAEKPGAVVEASKGNFGYTNVYAAVATAGGKSKNKMGFQFQQSEGYRAQSSLNRSLLSWSGRFASSPKTVLKTTFLYSRLFYETPGGLTRAEYEAAPRSARPAGGGFPGAEAAKASIRQNTFLAGLSYRQQLSQYFSNSTSAYGMFTAMDNPAIRNYGRTREPHAGGRTVFRFLKEQKAGRLQLTAGAEVQQSFSSTAVFKNRGGEADTLQTMDDIPTRQSLLFFQVSFEKKGWELTAGTSLNYLDIKFTRSFPQPLPQQERSFSAQLAPRFSLARHLKTITVYGAVAKGFSPPTTAELLPSGSAVNLSLNAEEGVNYELGFRGALKDLSFDVNAFFFRLQNTIVQRRDAGGGDFYFNSGSTSQEGVETVIHYPFLKNISASKQSRFWLSHAWHRFRYKDFKQLNNDYSGHRLPGTPPHTVAAGFDVNTTGGLLAMVSYCFNDRLPLNDANTEYAGAYHLLSARLGFEKPVGNHNKIKLVAGAENLLNQKYSLGNDLNAANGRYYNAAAGRNFYASLLIQFLSAKN